MPLIQIFVSIPVLLLFLPIAPSYREYVGALLRSQFSNESEFQDRVPAGYGQGKELGKGGISPKQDDETTKRPATPILRKRTIKINLLDWPAPFAADVTGLPPILISESKKPSFDKLVPPADKVSAKKVGAIQAGKRGHSEKRGASKVTSPPFSEAIVKLVPLESNEPTPELTKLRERIGTCLTYHYTKPVNADALRPWSIMHGVLGYGQNSLVVTQGKRISAVDYLCQNGIGNDRRLLYLNQGKLAVAVGPGFQGHEGQLLAILAQVQTPMDHPLLVDGTSFTVRDLVEYEKLTCRQGTELTFKLMGLSFYLGSDEIWKDNQGQRWDLSRLMFEEMAQPINGAACGGTHRLMGLSYALAMRQSRGEKIDGQWQRAQHFLAGYIKQALALQNADGGFSTEFFESRTNAADPMLQLYSTGHCLEWLSISMTREQLVAPELVKMANHVLNLLETQYRPEQELHGTDVGPKGHALRALRLYEMRVFGETSNYFSLAVNDPRPVIGASEISLMQRNQRVVSPSSSEAATYLQTSSPSLGEGPSKFSQPNTRSRGLMRRR